MESRELDYFHDWTFDKESGFTNASPLFLSLIDEVARLIRDDAHTLLSGHAESTARLILSQLAHKHHLAPPTEKPDA